METQENSRAFSIGYVNGSKDGKENNRYKREQKRIEYDLGFNAGTKERMKKSIKNKQFISRVFSKKEINLSKKFIDKGLKAAHLTSENATDRVTLLNKLKTKEINFYSNIFLFYLRWV